MLDMYVQHLKDNFPTCKIEQVPIRNPAYKDAVYLIVSARNAGEWFEQVFVISKKITPLQWDESKEDLVKWEDKIRQELIRIKT